ncbi:MAG TPA: ComEC/Rec2 family competence protein [Verrucomicrobiae bacterium]|nr:ComEC/Rec2 family competence protein [Verrucomicrobiae bacterium]
MLRPALIRRQFHPSFLIGWGALGVLIGVVASQFLALNVGWALSVALLCGGIGFVLRTPVGVLLVLFAGSLLGVVRGNSELHGVQQLAQLVGHQVAVQGKVTDDPEYGKRGEQQLRISELEVDGQKVPGKLWVSALSILDIKRSDHVIVSGKLRAGFGAFVGAMSYTTVQAAERPVMNDPAREVRDWFAAGVRNAIPEPQASLGVGYVVGQRSALPPELDEQLQIAGLTHIVVASGYNLTILVRLARRIFSRHSKYLSFIAAAGMIASFVLVTGFSPSMSRAALVAGLSLLAWYYGRVMHPVLLLVFSAAVTVLINPFFIWGDAGWYLSFLAFAGVLIMAPMLSKMIYKQKTPGLWQQVLIETFSAQVLTLPVILYMFGTLSLVSLPANLVVVPLVPLAMLLTFIAGVGGVLAPPIAGWVGVPANALLQYMTGVVEWVARLPHAQIEVTFGEIALTTSYLGILGLLLILWRKTGYDFRSASIIDG